MSKNLPGQVQIDTPQKSDDQLKPGWPLYIIVLLVAINGLPGLGLIVNGIVTMNKGDPVVGWILALLGALLVAVVVVLCIGLVERSNWARIGAAVLFGIGLAQAAIRVAAGNATISQAIWAIVYVYLVYWLLINRWYFH